MPVRGVEIDNENSAFDSCDDADVSVRPTLPVAFYLRRVACRAPIATVAMLRRLVGFFRARRDRKDIPPARRVSQRRSQNFVVSLSPGFSYVLGRETFRTFFI